MESTQLLSYVLVIISLLLLGSFCAIIFKRINFPYTIGLVLMGLFISIISSRVYGMESIQSMRLTPGLILYIFLPALIFQASININVRLLWKNLSSVTILALPGLVIATLIVAVILGASGMLPWSAALLFGALISATDPVAVITLFENIGAPERLKTLVDGESLFNDATAIVMFNVTTVILATGIVSFSSIGHGCLMFLGVFLGGLGVGAFIAWILMQLIQFANNDPLIEISLTTVVAYAAFIVADHFLHVSGVMSALGAGIVINAYGETKFSSNTKIYIKKFWEYAAFVSNTFIFLLLGITEEYLVADIITTSSAVLPIMFFTIIAVLFARVVVVYGLAPLMNRMPKMKPISLPYLHVIFWGGLRGAVPLALALSLPISFPERKIIIELTLGVVLFTLLVQGTTIGFLIKLLGLDKLTPLEDILKKHTIIDCNNRAIKSLQEMHQKELFSTFSTTDQKISKYCQLNSIKKINQEDLSLISSLVWIESINIMKRTFQKLYENAFLSESIYYELVHGLNSQEDEVYSGVIPPDFIHVSPPNLLLRKAINSICKYIPIVKKRYKRYKMESISAKYQITAALYIALENIKIELPKFNKKFAFPESSLNECISYLMVAHDDARNELDLIIKNQGDFLEIIEERAFYQILHNIRMSELEQLKDNGTIPNSIAMRIADEFNN